VNEEAERTPLPLSEPTCPGLSSTLGWDDPQHLRGDLFTEEHLVAHALELARAHGQPSIQRTPGPLRRRFAQGRERIQEAYQVLAREARGKREPSPAEEWLLDNANVVEDQIREIAEDLPFGYLIELPRLAHGAMRGYPRVYGLCIDYLRHTDARVDVATLASFVISYQSVSRLTIGELWAVPIMLRLGLVLTVGALAASEARAQDRQRADEWAERLFSTGDNPAQAGVCLSELEQSKIAVTSAFLVQLLRRLREHDTPLELAREWIAAQCRAMDTTPEELTRREHLRQAADQVSVGNAITSMRAVSAFDWDGFFDRTSDVETTLRRDPLGAYGLSDKSTRDRYRHAVEDLARRSDKDEVQVAQEALELAVTGQREAPDDPVRAHVGYYLVDRGKPALERRVDYRPRLRQRAVAAIRAYPTTFYFGTLGLFTALLLFAAFHAWSGTAAHGALLAVMLVLFALPATEIALALVSSLVVTILPPRLLSRLDFERGIPDEHRTLVAVPVLLDSQSTLNELLGHLEVRALANPDPNLYFALLTDFTDADSAERAGDRELLELAVAKVKVLNERHGRGEHRYWLLHRRRLYNAQESRFMGWERKRGKLDELNQLLRGASNTTFSVVTPPAELLSSVQHVITLDADTELPRDVAQKLVATLAHPLNRPVVEERTRRVVRGHAVIQPRVGTLPVSSRRSRFAAIAAGPPGIDPYTTAVSDVYQDLFDQGSFVGKGIYDVDAFVHATRERVPENCLLSHDLFEGIFARSALATDIEVLDEQPSSYEVQIGRQHRWVRGDWQLLPWLMPRVPTARGRQPSVLQLLDWWKIFDNLRRSLVAPAIVLLAALSWFVDARVASGVLGAILAVFIVPLSARLLLELVRESSSPSRSFLGSLGGDLRSNAPQVALNLVFMLDQAWVSLDAMLRTLYRVYVSHTHLLEWTTMRQASQRVRPTSSVLRRLWIASIGCALALLAVAMSAPHSLPLAVPLLLFWSAAPLVAWWLAQPLAAREPLTQVSAADRHLFRLTARKTWRFFETFVTVKDNFLPPDNFQEDPRGVVAHRTSPTNIGLYLLTVVSARDLSFITVRQAAQRLARTLATLERMDKREGHILNWYDTTSLKPLEPQYVSTVDSGNLAAYLWTLREAMNELMEAPIVSKEVFASAQDAIRLALLAANTSDSKHRPEARRALRELDTRLGELAEGFIAASDAATDTLAEAAQLVATSKSAPWVRTLGEDAVYWLDQADLALADTLLERQTLAPFWGRVARSPVFSAPFLRDHVLELKAGLPDANSPAKIARVKLEAQDIEEALQSALESGSLSADDHSTCTRELSELVNAVQLGARTSGELVQALSDISARAGALADAMNFRFLYDDKRELFTIGYNVSNSRLDSNHYDLLASEARLASLLAVAKGDAPQDHWFKLGRPRARVVANRRALLSWSGSMFEYLMPLLVTRNNSQTLLDEAYESAIERQVEYCREQGVPWGISESAYNVMDLGMTYQYRAFGVPGLGLKTGLGEDLVVAPYATVLAGLVRPDLIGRNLRQLQKEGADGRYGFYEAIDYTPEHVPPGRRGIVVKCFMAHHQGMSLVALANILTGNTMQRRFHQDTRIKATELLLEERIPVRSPLFNTQNKTMPKAALEPHVDVADHVGLGSPGPVRVHLLGHGELSSLISATGSGVTTWKGLDVNRFREDPLCEAGGIYLYVRNLSEQRTWSAAYQPTRAEPDFYDTSFSIDRVEFHRRDGEIQTVTEIALSPEHATEVRRVTLSNHSGEAVEMDVTTYTEVVLQPRAGDVAHRAFGSLFIETEAIVERNALLARRRPRGKNESEVWMVQVLAGEGDQWGPLDFESSRVQFLGRGRGPEAPEALTTKAPLSKRTGSVLDPVLALRRRIKLAPNATARLTLTTGLASSRQEALGLVETYAEQNSIARAIELGWAGVRVELRHLGITPADVHRFQRLLSATIFPHPSLRTGIEHPGAASRGKNALWAQGISGDLPIVLVRIDDADFSDLVRDVVLAHEFWRLNGFTADLVILNEEPSGYLQPTQDRVRDLMRQATLDQRGGVFLRRADQMSEEDRELITCAARVVLRASQGSLARQLRRALALVPRLPEELTPALKPPPPTLSGVTHTRPRLAFDNGIGGFDEQSGAYVMLLGEGTRTPNPWCNVMANPSFGTAVSEAGTGFTWFGNSQRHRLTPWSNDAVSDPSGEAIYVRDDEDGSFWSPTPQPCGAEDRYSVRHGRGYTRFEHTRRGLVHELTVFVSPDDPVKICRLIVDNREQRARQLSVFGLVEWVLGNSRETSRVSTATSWDAERGVLFASNPFSLFPRGRAFFAASRPVTSASGDRDEFFGVASSRKTPEGLLRTKLSGRTGAGLDPCAVLQVSLRIAPGERTEVAFVLGQGSSLEHAQALAAQYTRSESAAQTLAASDQRWEEILGTVQIKTPDAALDLIENHWLLYQATSSRLWARSGFYQSSGAFGYRDQLQDVLALLHARPDIAREQLLRCAARQFVEGDVQHWWHPETGDGVRTHCSDDMLWLPYVTAEYVRVTGDRAVLDESVPFLVERALGHEEDDLFSTPAVSEARASLYEHCTRALDNGATASPRGLPLMRGGDWNDGMNRVGEAGRGESVWLAWFLARTLKDFLPVALGRGDRARMTWCNEQLRRLADSVDKHAWDGQWYHRASFDDGTPLGSHTNSECSIDAIAQSWAVIAGVGDRERASQALRSALERLVSPAAKLMRLLDPPFQHMTPNPGYIQAYPLGVRENGGQYTHGVLWTLLALTLEHDGDRAGELLALLNPVHHADSRQAVERYRVEPYVIAADVYSHPDHSGRGGWTWYTGAAGWLYRIVLENVIGLRRRANVLLLSPCIPSTWPGFQVRYRHGRTVYQIDVDNPRSVSRGVARVEVDGKPVPDGQIRLIDDGAPHRVKVTLGDAELDPPRSERPRLSSL
jgi:cyclic beta-1,2-glucan synthetase